MRLFPSKGTFHSGGECEDLLLRGIWLYLGPGNHFILGIHWQAGDKGHILTLGELPSIRWWSQSSWVPDWQNQTIKPSESDGSFIFVILVILQFQCSVDPVEKQWAFGFDSYSKTKHYVCFQTAHPSTYVEFSKVNTRKKRRRDGDEQTIDSADDATDESIPEPKQEDTPFSFFEKKKCTKKRADELIMNYIVSDMRPLSTVESHAFKQMILGINPSIGPIMSRKLWPVKLMSLC